MAQRKKSPDRESKVLGSFLGGGTGAAIGTAVGGPLGAAIGAGFGAWLTHVAIEQASNGERVRYRAGIRRTSRRPGDAPIASPRGRPWGWM